MKACFIVDEDLCWNISILNKTIPVLVRNKIIIKKIWICPKKLSNLKGNKIYLWYFQIFGFYNFIILGLFYLTVLFRNFINNEHSFKKISEKYKINIEFVKNPNKKKIINYIKKENINLGFCLTDHIFKKNILRINKFIMINKHASLLPNYRGLLPYFWSKIDNNKNGISFHIISNKIDSGNLVFQKVFKKKFHSLVNFYLYVEKKYPEFLLKSINNLKKKKIKNNKFSKTYYSLPNSNDFKKFKKAGGKIIRLNDIFNKIID